MEMRGKEIKNNEAALPIKPISVMTGRAVCMLDISFIRREDADAALLRVFFFQALQLFEVVLDLPDQLLRIPVVAAQHANEEF